MSSIKLPDPDSYTVRELAEHWKCSVELVNHYIIEQRSLRLGRRVRDYPGTFSVALMSEGDNALFDALTAAVHRLVSQPMEPGGHMANLDEIFEYGVLIYQEDIGVKFYKRLFKYAEGKTAKSFDGADFIYEDSINRPDATSYDSAIENYPRNRKTLNKKNQRRFPSLDDRADAVTHANQIRPGNKYEYNVTGQDFEGNRFLRMRMDVRGNRCHIWPFLRSGFTVIPREEKERVENKPDNRVGTEPGGESENGPDSVADEKPREDLKPAKYEDAFDPLKISVIAKIFPLIKSSDINDIDLNQKRWKYLAGKASQNGLIRARVKKGSGNAESTFNPYLVGVWVITINRGLDPELVNRKLSGALPRRSEHLKGETFV